MTNEEPDSRGVAPHVPNARWANGGYIPASGVLGPVNDRFIADHYGCDYVIPLAVANRMGLRNLEILAASIANDHTELGASLPTDD